MGTVLTKALHLLLIALWLTPLHAMDGLEQPLELDEESMDLDIEDIFAFLEAEDVVTIATRHEQPRELSPSSITVITREEILATGHQTIEDILRLVPGAKITHYTEAQSLVGLRAGTRWQSDLLLFLVDGRDVTLPLFGTVLPALIPIDVDDIERVEILRGPGSTLYGANAFQGVVNIVTRTADLEQTLGKGVALRSSERHPRGASAYAEGSLGDWGIRAEAGWQQSARDEHPDEPTFEKLRGRLVAKRSTAVGDLRLEAGDQSTSGTIYTGLGRGPLNVRWPYLRAGLRTDRSEINAVIERTRMLYDVDMRLIYNPGGEQEPIDLVRDVFYDYPLSAGGIWGQRHWLPADTHRLTAGGELRLLHHSGMSYLVTCPPNITMDSFEQDDCVPIDLLEVRIGSFLQHEWSILENLHLTLGLRGDAVSVNVEPGISPRAALVWSPLTDHVFRTSFGMAFRKPSFAETHGHLLTDTDTNAPAELQRRVAFLMATGIGNPDLKHSRTSQVELAWRARWLNDQISTEVDLYGVHISNMIMLMVYGPVVEQGIGGMPMIREDAEVIHVNEGRDNFGWGGEWTASFHSSSLPWLRASLGYAHSSLWSSERKLTPIWTPNRQITGSLRLGRLLGPTFGVDAQWKSEYVSWVSNPRSHLDPFVSEMMQPRLLVNSTIGYTRELGQFMARLDIGVINLLDTPMREVTATEGPDGLFGGDELRRRLQISLRLSHRQP